MYLQIWRKSYVANGISITISEPANQDFSKKIVVCLFLWSGQKVVFFTFQFQTGRKKNGNNTEEKVNNLQLLKNQNNYPILGKIQNS